MSDFERAVKTAAERAVLKIIADGSWVAPDYANRFKLPGYFLDDCWRLVDVAKVKARFVERLESELADRMINAMAAELATDIKQILSVAERREMLRSLARQHMDAVMKAGQ
jgi:hypothetical protein